MKRSVGEMSIEEGPSGSFVNNQKIVRAGSYQVDPIAKINVKP